MLKLGFDKEWVALIMRCISSTTFAININEESVGRILPKRELRQGDPISPYLFLLCAEGLYVMLKDATNQRQITGLAIAEQSPIISHLFFVDDSLIFITADLEKCYSLRKVLNCYEKASG